MADEGDLSLGESKPFPKKPHESITLRPAAWIAMSASRKNESAFLWRNFAEGPHSLAPKGIYHQRMARIDVVMMNENIGMLAALFGNPLA
jgi:hypothetical protein